MCDDEPAAPTDVLAYVCELLSIARPADPVRGSRNIADGKTFWADNRRVRNHRIKSDLGVDLAFPDYRIGMRAVLGI